MRILVVEDDAFKRDKLVDAVSDAVTNCAFEFARSYKSGLRSVVVGGCDLVLLDMTLPSFDISEEEDGGPPLVFGGREVLRQMKRRGIKTPVIVVTQFEQFDSSGSSITLAELTEQLAMDYADIVRDVVYYNPTQSGWRDHLRAALGVS